MRQSYDESDKFVFMKIFLFLNDLTVKHVSAGMKTEEQLGLISSKASTVFPSYM